MGLRCAKQITANHGAASCRDLTVQKLSLDVMIQAEVDLVPGQRYQLRHSHIALEVELHTENNYSDESVFFCQTISPTNPCFDITGCYRVLIMLYPK